MKDISVSLKLDFSQIVEIVKQMPEKERLELNKLLWEETYEIPDEHKKAIDDRLIQNKKDPSRMLNWDEVKQDL